MPSTVTPMPKWAVVVPQAEPGRPYQTRKTALRTDFEELHPCDDFGNCPGHHPDRQSDTERGKNPLHAPEPEGEERHQQRKSERRIEPLGGCQKVPRFQASIGPNGTAIKQRHHQRSEGQIEERFTDRDHFAGDCVQHQRIERPDQNRGAGRRQEEVVENQPAFPADRGKQPPCFSIGARQAKSDSEPPMKRHRSPRIKTPRDGSVANA
jgi:hypothetical protein